MGTDKTYLVLTPEKIEDIFRDLETKLFATMPFYLYNTMEFTDEQNLRKVIESKKQELLKSIK